MGRVRRWYASAGKPSAPGTTPFFRRSRARCSSEMLKGSCSMARRCSRLKTLGTCSRMVFLVWGSSSGRASPCCAWKLSRTAWRTASGSLVRPPSGVRTAWMVRRPVSSRMRLTYRRDLYGVSFLPYLSRSWAAAAMRWACHSWSWWRRVVRSARRWASRSRASGVLGRSRVASSPFVVQMSWTSCWRVRSGGAPVWLVSRSMPHACAARRMAVVSVGATGRRRMPCRALFYLCQAPWSSSAGNCSVGGRVSSGRVAAGGGRSGMMRSM